MNSHEILISSESNEQFKFYESLLTSKGIRKENSFLLMGDKLIREFLDQIEVKPQLKLTRLLVSEKSTFRINGLKTTLLSSALFKKLDVLGTGSPLLLIAFKNFDTKEFSDGPRGLEIVTPLGDPKNLGSLCRSALAFGASEIILTKESTHPFLPHAIKASAGAVLKVKFFKSPLAISEIPIIGDNFALDLSGKNIESVSWPENLRLWIGEEGPGLKLTKEQIRKIQNINIATSQVESLNATVSASIALWEYRRTLKLKS